MSKTPILDRDEPAPAAKRSWRGILLGGALGVVLGLVLAVFSEGVFRLNIPQPSNYFVLEFVFAFYISVLVHELGHASVGLATGFEIRGMVVGAFVFERQARGWHFRFVARRLLSGGMTMTAPKHSENLAARYIRLVSGGPAASAFLVLVTFTLPATSLTRIVLGVSLLIGISSCIPRTAAGQPNDGKIILTLARRGPAADRMAAIMYLLSLDAQGIEPRDWPREFVDRLGAPKTDTAYLAGSLAYQYASALENTEPEIAAAVLESALSLSNKMSPDFRRVFFLTAASFQGIYRKNAVLAEAWMDQARKVKGAVVRKDWDSKPLGAIAFAKGRYSEAAEFLKRYVALLDRQPRSGVISAERTRVMALLNSLETSGEPKPAAFT